MADSVKMRVPADERFRGIVPDVGGRYVVAAGGSEADAAALAGALSEAMNAVTAHVNAPEAAVNLEFRSPGHAVEITVRCDGTSSVVTHPLPATKA